MKIYLQHFFHGFGRSNGNHDATTIRCSNNPLLHCKGFLGALIPWTQRHVGYLRYVHINCQLLTVLVLTILREYLEDLWKIGASSERKCRVKPPVLE